MEKIWYRFAREFVTSGHIVSHFSRCWPDFADRETVDGIEYHRLRGYSHTRSLPINLTLDFAWGLRVARRLPAADIVACNTVTLPAHLRTTKPTAGRVVAVLGRMPKGHAYFYGGVDRLVATSDAVRAEIVRERPRLADRTKVFPNPIDWSLHQQPRPANRTLTIGYVGRIHPEKGLELLVDAAVELNRRPGVPPWQIHLVGPQTVPEGGGGTEFVEKLRRRAAAANAPVLIDPPIFDPAALARIYSQFDVFCYPSLAEKGEGLSVAPLEAMAAGAAPVLSSLDCYREIICEGKNGFTFEHRAANAAERLASCFDELLRHPELRGRLGDQARQDVRRFDYSVVAADLLADFATLCAAPRH